MKDLDNTTAGTIEEITGAESSEEKVTKIKKADIEDMQDVIAAMQYGVQGNHYQRDDDANFFPVG